MSARPLTHVEPDGRTFVIHWQGDMPTFYEQDRFAHIAFRFSKIDGRWHFSSWCGYKRDQILFDMVHRMEATIMNTQQTLLPDETMPARVGWRPVDTAPLGKWVMIAVHTGIAGKVRPKWNVAIAQRGPGETNWTNAYGKRFGKEVLGWRPLPESPLYE